MATDLYTVRQKDGKIVLDKDGKPVPEDFICSVGENAKALEEGGIQWGGHTTRSLARELRQVANGREPTHGRFWPRVGEDTDVATVAGKVAGFLDARPDKPVFVK